MICSRCNSEVADGLKFCNTCGNKLIDIRNRQAGVNIQAEAEETSLLEDTSFPSPAGIEETTLLESAPVYSQPSQTIQPPPNNPVAPATDYRYTPKKESGSKDKIIVASVVAVVVVVVALLLILT